MGFVPRGTSWLFGVFFLMSQQKKNRDEVLLLARAVPQVSPAVPADVIASVSNASRDGSYTIPIRAGLRTAFLY